MTTGADRGEYDEDVAKYNFLADDFEVFEADVNRHIILHTALMFSPFSKFGLTTSLKSTKEISGGVV